MADDEMDGRFDDAGYDQPAGGASGGGGILAAIEPQANLLIHEREINQQVATARKYPRDVRGFIGLTKNLVIADEDTAMECIYALPKRKGSDNEIVGPSVRFAELVGSCWGNSRYASRLIEEGSEFLTAQGLFHDLERNIAVSVEVKRRIVTSTGKRYGVDMIGVTSAAAMSIALRNAILKGIPGPLWKPAYAAASSLIAGTFESIEARRRTALKAYAAIGIEEALVLEMLGVNNAEQIEPKHMLIMRGTLTALRDGDTTQRQVFGNLPSVTAKRASIDLGSKVQAGRESAGAGQGGGRSNGETVSRQEPQGGTARGAPGGGAGNRAPADAVPGKARGAGSDGRDGGSVEGSSGRAGGEDPRKDAPQGDTAVAVGESQGAERGPQPEAGPAAAGDAGGGVGVSGGGAPADSDGAGPGAEARTAPVADAGIPAGDWKPAEKKLLGNIVRDLGKAKSAIEVRDVEDSYREAIKVKGPDFQKTAMGLIDTAAAKYRAARGKL
jgi:hypothetical protein